MVRLTTFALARVVKKPDTTTEMRSFASLDSFPSQRWLASIKHGIAAHIVLLDSRAGAAIAMFCRHVRGFDRQRVMTDGMS
jgi:hypothetical protein